MPGTEKSASEIEQEQTGVVNALAALVGIPSGYARLVTIAKDMKTPMLQSVVAACKAGAPKIRIVSNVMQEELDSRSN